MSDLIPLPPAALAARELARDLAERSKAPNTLKAYAVAWGHFVAWCAAIGVCPLPCDPADVAAYIASMTRTHAPATIEQRLAAIGHMHKLTGHDWRPDAPAIANTWDAIQREFGRPPKKAAAITLQIVRKLVATCDNSPIGVRDRAMILLNFAGGFRRSEVVTLTVSDVTIEFGGARINIRRAKGDQYARGSIVNIPNGKQRDTCPVVALNTWLTLLGRADGPLFRRLSTAGRLIGSAHMHGGAVWDILERRAALAGVEAPPRPHGVRAGCITAIYRAGGRDRDLMQHVRIKDIKTLHGYVRDDPDLDKSPARLLDL